MDSSIRYMPTFRARQQELLVLGSFDFGNHMYPLIEIIKEKDRSNNRQSWLEIYGGIVQTAKASKVFVDLPVYIKDVTGLQPDVINFNRLVLSDLARRIDYLSRLAPQRSKVIPVVSSLHLKTAEADTITTQYNALKVLFPSVAIRTFSSTFNHDLPEIRALLTSDDYLIYDVDKGIGLTSPIITVAARELATLNTITKIALRSAVNTDIQNVSLVHGDIVYEADNSMAVPTTYGGIMRCDAFGDYVGIKKDDLTAGGTISPGFIFYNPVNNLYYGYKANIKSLDEFENTIVPAVLDSAEVRDIAADKPDYLNAQNWGWTTLNNIRGGETGKSQAKFKRIAMEHYLHCIRVKIEDGDIS